MLIVYKFQIILAAYTEQTLRKSVSFRRKMISDRTFSTLQFVAIVNIRVSRDCVEDAREAFKAA